MVLNKKNYIGLGLIISCIILAWFGVNKSVDENCYMAFFDVFPGVFFFFFAYFLGLMYLLSCGENNMSFNRIANIRGRGKQHKLRLYRRDMMLRSAIYCILFSFVTLIIAYCFNGSEVNRDILDEYSVRSYYNSMLFSDNSMWLGIVLCIIRLFLHTVLITSLYVCLEVLVKGYKYVILAVVIIASCTVDYTGIPVLSIFSYGVDYDFLFGVSDKEMLVTFAVKNMYLVIMSFVYSYIAVLCSDKLDLNRV